jgi:hypothetical protein
MENSDDQIINKVAGSSLITFDLEDYYQQGVRVSIDVKDQLFQGLILREKDFREFIKNHDWASYQKKYVAVYCSADAIVPTWAYMLLAIALQPYATRVVFGTIDELETVIFNERLAKIDWAQFSDAKVVVKGCSKINVPVAVYVEATTRLMPFASSIMFGEPCSTVPLFKKAKVR